ncbi:MAG TPA: hypothetical protein VHU43_08300 [Steroidobacteraceae bacterium]|nr:hypothetical protein [Steroidobacteraceae bacterium]
MRLMIGAVLCIPMSGCVIGSGPCLWLQVRHDFTGRVHFREFPRSDGVDMVPILILDKTQYMYAPPQSFHCLAANDVQLAGMTEFPSSIGENSHVIVDGKMIEGVTPDQHTRFVINVISILPLAPKH